MRSAEVAVELAAHVVPVVIWIEPRVHRWQEWRNQNAHDSEIRPHIEANEIACRLYHTLGSIENYVTTFARVAVLVDKGYADDEIAFVMRRSGPLVAAYRALLEEFRTRPGARRRLAEILSRAQAAAAAKKGGCRP